MLFIAEILIFISTLFNTRYFILCQGGGWEVSQTDISSMQFSVHFSCVLFFVTTLIIIVKGRTLKEIRVFTKIFYFMQYIFSAVILLLALINGVIDALRVSDARLRSLFINTESVLYLVCIIVMIIVISGLIMSKAESD